jgi:hypothetical protein
LFAPGAARPADNNTVIIEFLVDDVDGVHRKLAGFVEDFVNEPTTMPWGNRPQMDQLTAMAAEILAGRAGAAKEGPGRLTAPRGPDAVEHRRGGRC